MISSLFPCLILFPYFLVTIYVFCDLIELYHSTGICQYISGKKRRNFFPGKQYRNTSHNVPQKPQKKKLAGRVYFLLLQVSFRYVLLFTLLIFFPTHASSHPHSAASQEIRSFLTCVPFVCLRHKHWLSWR